MIQFDAGSPEWWLHRLGSRLEGDRPRLDRLSRYGRGEHDLPEGHARSRESFARFQRRARSNFTGLVADAVLDRLAITGFRMGDPASEDTAHRFWQANRMDADQSLVLHDALTMGRSYMIVGPNADGVPTISVEDPRQVIHESEPGDRRRVRAALKTWADEAEGREFAVVYLPDGIHYFSCRTQEGVGPRWGSAAWERTEDGDGGFAAAPVPGVVPVVPFVNRPEKDLAGYGEFEDVLDVQDRINQGILDRLVVGAVGAFRQRWVTGLKLVDAEGKPIQRFDPGADLMWGTEGENVKFGSFDPTDLKGYIEPIRVDVEHLAAISRTPTYYLLGSMVNVSGDALTAAESGLTSKAKRRARQFGESAELVMSVAFRMAGMEPVEDAEVIWDSIERENPAAVADGLVKKQVIGVPWRQLMEDSGYTPAQIKRMQRDRAGDVLLAGALGEQVNGFATGGRVAPGGAASVRELGESGRGGGSGGLAGDA